MGWAGSVWAFFLSAQSRSPPSNPKHCCHCPATLPFLPQVAGGAAAAAAGGAAPAPPLRDMWAVTFRDLPDYMYLLQRQDHKARVCWCV